MQGIGDCMKAMKASAQYARTRQELLASLPAELMTLSDYLSADTVMLDEKKSKSLLAKAGLRVPRSVLITDPDQISDGTISEDMMFPLVAKAVSPDMPHKTEYGAIKLGLDDLAAVAGAYKEIHDNCKRLAPDARIEGIMIEEYVADTVTELMISMRRDTQFGCILTIASGGILVELIKDAVTMIMPGGHAHIRHAIQQLAAAKLINGYRGHDGGNMDTVIATIISLSDLMANHPALHMIEINPLIVTPNEAIIADAVIHSFIASQMD